MKHFHDFEQSVGGHLPILPPVNPAFIHHLMKLRSLILKIQEISFSENPLIG
jgi:hypothetical protein